MNKNIQNFKATETKIKNDLLSELFATMQHVHKKGYIFVNFTLDNLGVELDFDKTTIEKIILIDIGETQRHGDNRHQIQSAAPLYFSADQYVPVKYSY